MASFSIGRYDYPLEVCDNTLSHRAHWWKAWGGRLAYCRGRAKEGGFSSRNLPTRAPKGLEHN